MVVVTECKSENINAMYTSPDIENVKEKIPEKEYSEIFLFIPLMYLLKFKNTICRYDEF